MEAQAVEELSPLGAFESVTGQHARTRFLDGLGLRKLSRLTIAHSMLLEQVDAFAGQQNPIAVVRDGER
jgi:hypothetical protein